MNYLDLMVADLIYITYSVDKKKKGLYLVELIKGIQIIISKISIKIGHLKLFFYVAQKK